MEGQLQPMGSSVCPPHHAHTHESVILGGAQPLGVIPERAKREPGVHNPNRHDEKW